MPGSEFIQPDWPAPERVQARVTTRQGGYSVAPYSSFNLADHAGDNPAHVLRNRQQLIEQVGLPTEPVWLQQEHGTTVCQADLPGDHPPTADAAFSCTSKTVCAVMTADCLPVLFSDHDGSCVAAAHAGWRGLQTGILEATVAAMPVEPNQLMAWLGPAIGAESYEVGDEVRTVFLSDRAEAEVHFIAHGADHWLMDMYGLARQRLAAMGITAVYGGGFCTYKEEQRFYSYRRDGDTGRMASLIWLTDN